MKAVEKGIWRFSERLPPIKEECKMTLGEGNTPLLRLRGLNIWVKADHVNPTSSFKDRGVAYLISKIVEEGSSAVVIDSSGNAAVSTAAYCARSGIGHVAVMPEYSHKEKKVQVLWHGSRVVESPDRDTARLFARRLAKELDLRYIGFALEPHALPGFRTTAYELDEWITPEAVFIPTGSGTNLVAIGEAYLEIAEKDSLENVPQIHAVQSAACAPISERFVDYTPIESTLAEGVIVPVTERKDEAIRIVNETGGTGWVVSDDDIYRALRVLASNGIYASPTGAVAVAAALKSGNKESIVCIVTGSGLKANLMLEDFQHRVTSVRDETELQNFIEQNR